MSKSHNATERSRQESAITLATEAGRHMGFMLEWMRGCASSQWVLDGPGFQRLKRLAKSMARQAEQLESVANEGIRIRTRQSSRERNKAA